jgi:phosphate transport system protein
VGKHLQRDLDLLKKHILTMGSMVEEAINKAINALVQRREDLAIEVKQGDDAIDEMENEIESQVLKTLALHQPVAGDLRFVVMVLKFNHELERMGDLAANMAKRTLDLLLWEPLQVDLPIVAMGELVRSMVHQSLDSLVQSDAELARHVCRTDDEVDRLHREMFDILLDHMQHDPATIKRAVDLLSLSRQLERIADHTTNIAEDLVFQVEGEVIRHRPERGAHRVDSPEHE